jgi:hypothetical protein
MKTLAGLAALAVAVPTLAHAATLSGKYSARYTTLCQSIEQEVLSPSTQIQTVDRGKILHAIGFITFMPSAPGGLSGKISAQLSLAKGSLAILGTPTQPAAPDMKINSGTTGGTFALTPATATAPATLKFAYTGGKPSILTIYLSEPVGGVYRHADFIDLEGAVGGKPNCTTFGSADRK